MGEEDASVPEAAEPRLAKDRHGGHRLLCWDCGPWGRSLPSEGLLETRKLLEPGRERCVKSWTTATTVGPWRCAAHSLPGHMLDGFR